MLEQPFRLLTLENADNVMPLLDAELNGHPVRLIIDTGASHTCLDKSVVKKYAPEACRKRVSPDDDPGKTKENTVMGLGGRRLSHAVGVVGVLKIGELEIRDYMVVAVRLANINKMLRWIGQEPIDGLLGCDILRTYRASLDFERQQIVFSSFQNNSSVFPY